MSMPVNLLTKTGEIATTRKTIPDGTSWPTEIVWNSRYFKYVNATGPASPGTTEMGNYTESFTQAAAS